VKPVDPRLLPHLAPARVPLAGAVLGGTVAGALVVAQAFAVAWLVTALLDRDAAGSGRAALTVLAVTSGRAAAGWVVDAASARASSAVVTELRRKVVAAALALGSTQLSRRRSGELGLLATRGVAAVDPYLTRYLPALVLAAVLPGLTVVAIATQDLLSAVIVVVTLPLVPVFAILVGMATRDRAERQWRVLSQLSGHFVDVVRGLPTLVVFRRAEVQGRTIRQVTDRYRRATNETLRLAFASSAVLELVATLSVALVAVTVGLRLSSGSLELFTALVVLLLAPEAYWPLRRVGAEFHAAAEGTATFEAVDSLLTEAANAGGVDGRGLASAGRGLRPSDREAGLAVSASQARPPRLALTPSRTGGRYPHSEGEPGHGAAPVVELLDVTVAYSARSAPVLRAFSASIPARGVTAVTGPSGAGKSTLLQVLTGELVPSQGEVVVGGATLAEVGPEGLRGWQERVAWLPQRPWLLPGSVRDNVRLGRPDATDADVWAALERVGLADLVRSRDAGLELEVGEDGLTLSAGERARLALARVVVSRREVVLLDEPSAHLDPATEEVVAQTLTWLGQRCSVVVVAHRDRLVEIADHVITVPTPADQAPAPADPSRPEGFSRRFAREATSRPLVASPPANGSTPTAPDPSPTHDPARSSVRLRLWTGTVLGALAAASGVALTATAGWLIARAAEHPPVLMLMVAIVGVRTFGVGRPVLRYAERLVSHDAALRMLADRRANVYDVLVPLVPGRLGRERGDVLTSIVDDVDAVVDQQLRVHAPLLTFALVSGLAVLVTAWVLPAAALVVVTMTALGGGVAFAVARTGAASAERDHVEARARLGARMVQTLQGAADLRMWQAQADASRLALEESRTLTSAQERSARAVAAGRLVSLLAAGAGVTLTAQVGLPALERGTVSGPMLALLVLLPLALLEVLTPVADAAAVSVRAAAARHRLTDLLSQRPAVTATPHPQPRPADTTVDLDGVTAGWGPTPVLTGLDLTLHPGSRVGVVGPSGSGKSTLAALLLRFLDPQSGRVTLGGTDVRALSLDDVRRTTVLVDDDPHVFASTLRENLRLARPGADDGDLRAALEVVSLGPWLDGLPDGLDTALGEGAAQVSGGERARIGLARAVLADPDVLVLDEPTAHLDTATARAVATDLLEAGGARTIVWITHTEVGLDRMDRVLDLDEDAVPLLTG